MKKSLKYLLLSLILIASCSKDDNGNPTTEKFGTIKAVVTYQGDMVSTILDIKSTSGPADSDITYINTGETYKEGPESTQAVKTHTFQTTDKASNLNIGLSVNSDPGDLTLNHSYTIEYYFNGSLKDSQNVTRNNKGYIHLWSWNTTDGLVELSQADVD